MIIRTHFSLPLEIQSIKEYNISIIHKEDIVKKFYSVLGSILGFLIILLYAFENVNLLFGIEFTGSEDILGYFDLVQQYLIYALAGIAGLELVAGKKLFAFIFFLILAFVVVSTFFPDVTNNLIP
jgi:hypothetical protein